MNSRKSDRWQRCVDDRTAIRDGLTDVDEQLKDMAWDLHSDWPGYQGALARRRAILNTLRITNAI